MERLGDCLEFMHSTWLASSFSTCFPQRPRDRPSAEGSKGSAARESSTSQYWRLDFITALT